MAIPPIISNLPLLKLFKSAPEDKTAPVAPSAGQMPKDVINLSKEAQQALQTNNNPIRNDQQARAVASDTRDLLAEHDDIALGLKPDAPL